MTSSISWPSDEVARHASAPIIFCRNVFIYFSERSIRRALDAFERLMPSPGYLVRWCGGVSAATHLSLRFGGDWRRFHVRQGQGGPAGRPGARKRLNGHRESTPSRARGR